MGQAQKIGPACLLLRKKAYGCFRELECPFGGCLDKKSPTIWGVYSCTILGPVMVGISHVSNIGPELHVLTLGRPFACQETHAQ